MRERHQNRVKTLRRGITLIETGVLMSLTAVLSGIIVTGMAAMFRYNRSTNNHQVGQTAMQQMTTTLRADIHEATRCQWNPESQTLTLELPDSRTLEYHKIKNRWVRVLTTDEAKPITTSFGLDDSFHCYCDTEEVNQGKLIRLNLMNRTLELPNESDRTVRTLRCDIVAIVGRDYFSLHD